MPKRQDLESVRDIAEAVRRIENYLSQAGSWSGWIEFFLKGVAEQSRDAIWRTGKLLDLWKSYRRRLLFTRDRLSPEVP